MEASLTENMEGRHSKSFLRSFCLTVTAPLGSHFLRKGPVLCEMPKLMELAEHGSQYLGDRSKGQDNCLKFEATSLAYIVSSHPARTSP